MERRRMPSGYFILYYGLLALFILMVGWMAGTSFTETRGHEMMGMMGTTFPSHSK